MAVAIAAVSAAVVAIQNMQIQNVDADTNIITEHDNATDIDLELVRFFPFALPFRLLPIFLCSAACIIYRSGAI